MRMAEAALFPRKETKVSIGQAIAFYVIKKYKALSPWAQTLVIQPIRMALLPLLTAAQIIFLTFIGVSSLILHTDTR
jgi:hypothetical protein